MKNKVDKLIYENEVVERVVFCILLATLFTAGMCHWIIDIEYYGIVDDKSLAVVNLSLVFVICAIISIYYLLRKKRIQFDMALVVLIQTFIFIGMLDYHYCRYPLVQYAWILPTAYITGKLAVGTNRTIANYRIEKIYLALASGILITTMLDFSMNFVHASEIGYRTEDWFYFWLKGQLGNRCTFEYGFVLVTAAAGYAIIVAKRKKIFFALMVIINVIIQALVISVQGRENRMLLPITLCIVGMMYYYDHSKSISFKTKKIILGCIIAFVALVAFGAVAFANNWFGLYDIYLNSVWSGSGGVFRNARFAMDWEGFQNMIAYPVEDYKEIYKYPSPHSMFLEYGRVMGVAVWGLLVVFRILIIKDMLRLAFSKEENSWIKYLLVPSFIALNLYYSMEPNGYAHRYFWLVGLLISGMIRGWLEGGPKTNEQRLY